MPVLHPHTLHTARRGSSVVEARKAVLVTIDIQRDAHGKPTKLKLRTGTSEHDNPKIFWSPKGHVHDKDLPREVLWTCVDLEKGEHIHIHAKPMQFEFFGWDAFDLDHDAFTVDTGHVTALPPSPPVRKTAGKHHKQHHWAYGVRLDSPSLHRPVELDPVIIIEEDP